MRSVRGLLLATFLIGGCESSVVSIAAVSDVEVLPPSITLEEGDRETASAVLKENGGAELPGRTVLWTADDPGVATVTADGVVEGRAPGTTVIRATSDGVSGAAEVTVVSGAAIGISPATIEIEAEANVAGSVTRDVDVANAGRGTLRGLTARIRGDGGDGGDPVSWLEVELLDHTAPTKLRIRVSAERVEGGSYEATVVVESSASAGGPVEVKVRLTIVETPEPEPEPEPGCDIRNHTFQRDLEIPEDTHCRLTNVRVRGDLRLRRGAGLTATDLRVDGRIDASSAGDIVLTDSRIFGRVELERGGSVTIHETSIDGELEIDRHRGRIDLRGNVIDRDLELERNRGGPFMLFGNRIDGSLECRDNDPAPIGGGNIVDGRKERQCREL